MSEIKLMEIACLWKQLIDAIDLDSYSSLWFLSSELDLSDEEIEKIKDYLSELG